MTFLVLIAAALLAVGFVAVDARMARRELERESTRD